ncbi:MdfA family multidrug efflux MFS transporter [Pseudomonas sp. v388]|uniref:MFS transporter n=1 Tax=Pseudomonas sp. v388 TaxID=2479849 RepID=UPI000F788746|nr:MFS transporter [Pseudomonas sp. v388]RRV10268.1 MdfA family multidrug efflux MFS transporter [Pseudomonas sp. v388]
MPRSLLFISARHALLFCLMLSLFELLVYAGSDMVMPGMLTVIANLEAQVHYVPWSLNAYLMGGVAFQWLIGPLSDRFGRRPLMLIGCAVFIIASLLSASVVNIDQFIALRFVQGIGMGFVIAVGYPALQESFSETGSVRLFAIFSTIGLLSPLLGPLLGTALLSVISWRTLFIVIAASGALVWLGLYRWMPETIGVLRRDGTRLQPHALRMAELLRIYGGLLNNRAFMAGSIALGLIGLPLLAWIALSPVLLIHQLDLSTGQYALWQLPVFGGMILGSVVLNKAAQTMSIECLLSMGIRWVIGGLGLALIMTLITGHIIALAAGLALYAFGVGICNATLYRLTLFSSERGKGAVSALLGMIPVAIFACGIYLLTALGACNSLEAYIIAAAFPAAAAVVPVRYVLAVRAATERQHR